MIYIHADDFGLNLETTLETMRLVDLGAINSVSVMAHSEHLDMISEFLRKKNIRVGIHFNIVDGFIPFYKNFYFFGKSYFPKSNLMRGLSVFHLLRTEDLIKELKLQINHLYDHGISIDHIDSHGHMHKFPVIRDAVIQFVLESKSRYKIRIAQNIFLENNKLFTKKINSSFNQKVNNLNINYGDLFYMPSHGFDLIQVVKTIALHVNDNMDIIVGVHPGVKESWNIKESLLCECLNSNIHV
jgi:predicted glycoside hydrolase/deacetylase ChbG (UPF0249 family)